MENSKLNTLLSHFVNECKSNFTSISIERKQKLEELAKSVEHSYKKTRKSNLVFVCTHNSRRSHFGQLMATIMAVHFGLDITSYSAGTETTRFHPNAIAAILSVGFNLVPQTNSSKSSNTVFVLSYSTDEKQSIKCFSKTIFDESLPKDKFIAIMVCSDANENCPFIPGADIRFSLAYEDPKIYDNDDDAVNHYKESLFQIGTELAFCFSKIKSKEELEQ